MTDITNNLIFSANLFYRIRQNSLPAKNPINLLLIIILTLFIATSAATEEKKGELDGKGLVCRRDDLYFSRPYYFIFRNRKALGPWVTIDTAVKLRSLRETEYQSTASLVSWYGHNLRRETLQLEGLLNGIPNKLYRCEIMDPEHMMITLQRKVEKLKK